MNANVRLTDAVIEAVLSRRAAGVSGDGLHDQIMAGVAATAQAPAPLIPPRPWSVRAAPSLRLAWVVALVGLLLALLVGSLLVGAWRPDRGS
jgi:hypothetical protein